MKPTIKYSIILLIILCNSLLIGYYYISYLLVLTTPDIHLGHILTSIGISLLFTLYIKRSLNKVLLYLNLLFLTAFSALVSFGYYPNVKIEKKLNDTYALYIASDGLHNRDYMYVAEKTNFLFWEKSTCNFVFESNSISDIQINDFNQDSISIEVIRHKELEKENQTINLPNNNYW